MEKRIRTNAEIDILNQFLSEGETALPYEVSNEEITPEIANENQQSAEQIAEQEKIEAEKIAAQKEIDDKEAKDKEAVAQPEAKVIAPEIELTDAQVLAYLKKAKGKEITSLDDFINPKKELTPEEKTAATLKREDDMFAYGLTQGLFSKSELSEFIKETANPTDLVYAAYAADQKAKDTDLTDKELREEFNEKFGVDIEDKEDRHYIAGQNLINKIAGGIINAKYPKIINLDKEYSSFETSISKQKELDNKIETQTPVYKNDLNQIKANIKTVSVPISEKENFELTLEDSVIEEVMSEMIADNFSKGKIVDGWDKDHLKQVAISTGIMKSLPKLLKDYSDKKELEKQAGLRGVKPAGKEEGRIRVAGELSENQKKALAMIDERLSLVAN
ncbi:MAG: hypothetical protein ABI091_26785 [Ferruginibacter sp.]